MLENNCQLDIYWCFTAQQKRDYSIAAGLQYEVGDKCQVSDYIEEEKILLEILLILIGTKKTAHVCVVNLRFRNVLSCIHFNSFKCLAFCPV